VAYLHQHSQLRRYVFTQCYYSVNFLYMQNIHRKIRETQNTSFVADIFGCDIHNE
jgi:hypothetical protein